MAYISTKQTKLNTGYCTYIDKKSYFNLQYRTKHKTNVRNASLK